MIIIHTLGPTLPTLWRVKKVKGTTAKKEQRKQKHSPTISCDLPSMMASTAPPAQNSIRICSREDKRNTGHGVTALIQVQV